MAVITDPFEHIAAGAQDVILVQHRLGPLVARAGRAELA